MARSRECDSDRELGDVRIFVYGFVNQKKRLQQRDQQTIADAGIDLQDVIAVHFYPDELVATMQQLIDTKYGDQASDLQEVTFKITGTASDLHFEIDNVKFGN